MIFSKRNWSWLSLLFNRPALVACVLTSLGMSTVHSIAADSPFPSKPVRIVVPFTAGGSADFFARLIGQRLAEVWNQQVVVDNRPGASTVIGTQLVARSPADGHTILVMANSFTINPSLRATLPYDNNKDFAPITQLVTSSNVIVVHPSVPAKTLAEFVALARAKPGGLNYSAVGPGIFDDMQIGAADACAADAHDDIGWLGDLRVGHVLVLDKLIGGEFLIIAMEYCSLHVRCPPEQ